jgi:hypothetical protein
LLEETVFAGFEIEVEIAFHVVDFGVGVKILGGVLIGRVVGVRSVAVAMKVGLALEPFCVAMQ